jgi:hypothetical protein
VLEIRTSRLLPGIVLSCYQILISYVLSLPSHPFRIQSPDGRSLALSTESGQIMILDTESRQVVATHTSHAMCVRTLSWSGDSQVSWRVSYFFSRSGLPASARRPDLICRFLVFAVLVLRIGRPTDRSARRPSRISRFVRQGKRRGG